MSWLKRLVAPPVEPWHFYFEFKSDQTGLEVALQRSRLSKLTRSAPFFTEIFKYWRELASSEPTTEVAVRNEFLWGNPFLKGKFKKKQEIKGRALGIFRLNDLLKYDQLMTSEQFTAGYGHPPPAGLLERTKQLVPQSWFRLLSPVDKHVPEYSLVVKNEKQDWVDFQGLSAKRLYSMFENKKSNIYSCSDRWLRAYNGDETFAPGPSWQEWHILPYRLSHEVQLQSFHFRILYRVIPCRAYLYQIKISESDTCEKCAARDDMFHFFFECPCTKEFWDSLATWLGGKDGVREFPDDLTEEEFMLGIVSRKGDYSLINYIILCAKFYVYKMKTFQLGDPDLYQFLVELKGRMDIERLTSLSDSSFPKRFKKWIRFFQDL